MPNEENLPVEKSEFIPTVSDDQDTGIENMEDEGLTLPRLKIMQPMTEDAPEKIEVGELFNSLTKEKFGTEQIFVPIFYFNSRAFFSDPKDGGEMLCRSFKGKVPDQGNLTATCAECKHGKWIKDQAPECTFNYNYVMVTQSMLDSYVKGDFDLPVLYMGHGVATKECKRLNSLIKSRVLGADKVPMYGQKFKIKTEVKKFDVGKAGIPHFEFAGYVTKEEYEVTKELYVKIKEQDAKGIVKDTDNAAQDQEKVKGDETKL